jgi:hypothetical protein
MGSNSVFMVYDQQTLRLVQELHPPPVAVYLHKSLGMILFIFEDSLHFANSRWFLEIRMTDSEY